jgi:exopolysaccharide biosynthesis polyprenyl glycosylphosphotransferase
VSTTQQAHATGLARRVRDDGAIPRDRSLGTVLIALDAGSLLVAALVVVLLSNATPAWILDVAGPWFAPIVVVLGMGVIAVSGLHQRRKCAIASVEISRVGRATAAGGVLALLLLQAADSVSPYLTALALGATTLISLVLMRSWFRAWLKVQRQRGRFLTPVAVVGQRGAVVDFTHHLQAHLDSGFLPVVHVDVEPETTIGPGNDGAHADLPRIGHLSDDLDEALERHGVRSAVLLADGFAGHDLRDAVRTTEHRFAHVQVVTNLVGISHARLVPTPLVGEMTFYLEPLASRWQRVVKRVMDVTGAALLLTVLSPLLLVIALAVWLPDRGPVFYAQERIGRGGRRIRILKFRSMIVDADKRLEELRADNERVGPLFKANRDPRITTVGRWLRATSLDELPQLWSILIGDMSLVGPRPALPAEVAEFDQIHQRRHDVRPGLTGLWQVEDRDHPDFERYRRHDVFYVDNWSLSLDLAILLQTAGVVLLRAFRAVLLGQEDGEVMA